MTPRPAKRAAVDRAPDPARESCPPAPPPVAGGQDTPSSPQPSERQAAGMPTPDPGAAGHAMSPAAPVRGRAQNPAGGELDADGSPSAGSTGAEWRKKVKAATSALHAAQRRGAHRYTKVADRTAGSQFRPGMAVRKPPEKPQGET